MSESSTDKQHLQDEIVKLQEKRKPHEAEKAAGKEFVADLSSQEQTLKDEKTMLEETTRFWGPEETA